MRRPNVKQWIVLWSGAAWAVGSLLIAEDYLARALIAGFIVTALLFWQLGGKRAAIEHPQQTSPPDAPPEAAPTISPSPEGQQLADAAPLAESESKPASPVAQSGVEPSGVGGWLILVVLGALVTPFVTVYVVSLYGEFWTDPWFFTVAAAGGILAGWSLVVALALLNRWPKAPKLAQILLIGSWCFTTCLLILAAITVGVDFSKTATTPSYVGSSLGVVLWFWYLQKSRRVRATYGPLPPGPIRPVHASAMALAAGALVCLVSIGIADFRRQSWAEFHSDDGHYKVEAPGAGRTSTLENGIIQVAFGNDIRGFVVFDAVPPENTNAQSYLENVRNAVAASLKASIVKTSSIDLGGHPGIDFVGTFPGNGITGDLRGRVYRTDSLGFVLLVTGPQGGRTASEADRFFRSFRIEP
jgi:Protein of unknown function (DUF2569)